ncbi:MAG: DUF349 domain-containing protein [Porphyromonas sp.]|nr:DUF349 domain-containing protein [Porphyromonas sp.]
MELNSEKNLSTPDEGAEVEVTTPTTPADAAEMPNEVETLPTDEEKVDDQTPTDETIVAEPAAEDVEDETPTKVDTSKLSLSELFDHLDEEIKAERLPDIQEMRRLKSLVNNVKFDPTDDTDLDDVEDDGEERDPEATETPTDKDLLMTKFINLKTRYHELVAKTKELEQQEQEQNHQKKLELIERLKAALGSTDDYFTTRNEFLNIRAEWKSIGAVPDPVRRKIIDEYSELIEKFYETKLNPEDQEHDYEDNIKLKRELISAAKALGEDKDVVKAFREVQALQDQWKEIGPVAPDFRDAVHKDFKDAVTVVNKRHDDHFKQIQEQEQKNLEKKKEIVESLEDMLIKLPTTREGWRNYERRMDKIQSDWRAAGRVPKSAVNEIRVRYRIAVDEFYLQRRTFMRELSEFISPRLERMRELAAEAEALKDSSDWKTTTKHLQEMQKEWTQVSKLGTRVAEAQRLWKRFREACDVFFQKKSEVYTSRMADREANFDAKIEVVERLEELVKNRPSNLIEELKTLREEWATYGRVPNEKKEELLDRYYGALRALTGDNRSRRGREDNRRQRGGGGDRQDRRPKKVDMKKDLTNLSNNELQDEESNIRRNITHLEEELRQYENNIGFFNASPDNPMVMQIQGKIDELANRIEKYNERLSEIKEEIKHPTPKQEEVAEETSQEVEDNTVEPEVQDSVEKAAKAETEPSEELEDVPTEESQEEK